jgi:hypothetical protein
MVLSIDKAMIFLFAVAMYLYTICTTFSKLTIILCAMYASVAILCTIRRKTKNIPIVIILFLLCNLMIGCLSVIVAFIMGVNPYYILLDSAGFQIIVLCIPILFYIIGNESSIDAFIDYFLKVGILVSVLSVFLFFSYTLIFGDLTLKSITVANIALASIGFDFKLMSSSGMLRVNTNAVQLIFICVFITALKINLSKNRKLIYFVVLFLGAFTDGHRVIAILTMLLIVFYYYTISVKATRNIVFISLAFLILAVFSDVILSRFDFSTESSTLRVEQVDSLLEKISEHPLVGSGIGSSASLIRNEERPFLYEVDTLAVMMKVGTPFAILYFLNWFIPLAIFVESRTNPRCGISHTKIVFMFIFVFSSLIYMTSNGGFSMSPLSAIFQICMVLSFVWVKLKVVPSRQ